MEENQNPTSQVVDQAPPVVPVQTPPNIPIQKPKSKFPLAVIIGIIIFLILAGGAAGFYAFRPQLMSLISKPTPTPTLTPKLATQTPSPTPDPTTNWKTYASDYGLSIKYPPSWLLRDDALYPLGETSDKALETIITFGAGSIVANASSPKVIKNYPAGSATYYLGGNTKEFPYQNGYATFTRAGSSYFFGFQNIPVTTDKTYETTIDQILSTLKFTANKFTDISYWKTYEGKGFTFKYPYGYKFEKVQNGITSFSIFYDITNEAIPSQLFVSLKPTIDSTNLKLCSEQVINGKCLDVPITEEVINGVKFRKINLQESDGHTQALNKYVVQAVGDKQIEFVHLVFGGGIENQMNKILSTFKFE